MGTNFYMMIKSKKLVDKYFTPEEYEAVTTPYSGYEVHIGKRSSGWKPIFQEHEKAYSSVKEMIEFIKSQGRKIRIFDEYQREFDVDGLIEELVNWGERQEKRIVHYDDRIGDIEVPIDHCEYYEKYEKSPYRDFVRYTRDEDGYNFLKGDFS